MGRANRPRTTMYSPDMASASTAACQAMLSARSADPAPRARATADVVAPPMDPAAIICIRVRKGKASARLARAAVPSCPTNHASANVTAVIMPTATTFGVARRQSTIATGASRICRMPGACAVDTSSRTPGATVTPSAERAGIREGEGMERFARYRCSLRRTRHWARGRRRAQMLHGGRKDRCSKPPSQRTSARRRS